MPATARAAFRWSTFFGLGTRLLCNENLAHGRLESHKLLPCPEPVILISDTITHNPAATLLPRWQIVGRPFVALAAVIFGIDFTGAHILDITQVTIIAMAMPFLPLYEDYLQPRTYFRSPCVLQFPAVQSPSSHAE